MKRWELIFKTFGNVNRLKIVSMLARGHRMNVTEIASELHISIKSTSKHLRMLQRLDVLDNVGANGHVYYTLGTAAPKDFKKVQKLFL